MKKVASILFTLIFLCLFFASCQKMKEPEQKKGVEAQRKELKQESSEVQAKGEGQPLISKQGGKEGQERSDTKVETFQTPSETEKKSAFKEPVLVWEREFDPPLIDISDQNSSGEYIAIQGGGKEGRPTKILFLDSKGRTVREIPLGKKEKRKIPPEQVWLTHYGEQWRDEKFKKSFKVGKEIESITGRAFVSGNGEYYTIVTQDTAFESAGKEADTYYSSWYEFAYYDKTGKFLWKAVPKDNYGFDKAYVSYDGSRILIVDEAILDYFGQRWYFYDGKGLLLKDEDHLVSPKVVQAEKDKAAREWLEQIKMSQNGKYISYIKGEHGDSKTGLMDSTGEMLWEKRFGIRHSLYDCSNTGEILIGVDDKDLLSITNEGKISWQTWRGSGGFHLSKDGKFAIRIDSPADPSTKRFYGWDVLYLIDNKNGNLILAATADIILNDPAKKSFITLSVVFSHGGERLLISFAEFPGGVGKKKILCFYAIDQKKVVWTKEDVGGLLRISDLGIIQILDTPKRVIVLRGEL